MYMFLLVFVISLGSLLAAADSKISYRKESNGIYLSAKDCASVEFEMKSLAMWSQNASPTPDCTKKPITKEKSCEVDVSSCLPPLVANNYLRPYSADWQGDEVDSPNCFGLALYTAGLSPAHNFARAEELYGYLKPPLCFRVTEGQEPKPGDIGVLHKEDETAHAFIYVSSQTVWNKTGIGRKQLSFFQNPEEMKKDLQYGDGCYSCKNIQPGHSRYKECAFCRKPFETQYYRCEDVVKTFRKTKTELDQRLLEKLDELDHLSCEASTLFFAPGALTLSHAKNLNQTVVLLTQYFYEENKRAPIADPPRNSRDWHLNLMSLRLRSLQRHMEGAREASGDEDPVGLQLQVNKNLFR